MKSIDAQFFKEHQSWCLTRVCAAFGRKLRVRIRRNAYDDQSLAIVEIWDGSQWNEVHQIPIQACKCQTVSYVSPNPDRKLFEADADALLKMAKAIIE